MQKHNTSCQSANHASIGGARVFILLLVALYFLSCKRDPPCEGCKNRAQPPTAAAGPDQVIALPTDSVSLDGSGSSDPGGKISAWQWTKLSGPASFQITNPNAPQTLVTKLVNGRYQFELTLTDAGGLTAKDTVTVAVFQAADTTTGGHWEIVVTLPINAAFLSDYERTDEAYSFSQIDGPSTASIDPKTGNGSWVRNLMPGVYRFERKGYSFGPFMDTIKVTVVDDPNEHNTITYKNLYWEYSGAFEPNDLLPRLKLTKPVWPTDGNPPIEVYLQMNFFNNGEWFKVPSSKDGVFFNLDCIDSGRCLRRFVIRPSLENQAWAQKKSSIKIYVL